MIPVGNNFSEGSRSNVGNIFSKPMEVRVSLQDKQDKLTATTAKIRKDELRGLIGFGASIYLLSEANGALF